jgi:hypothetical protein
LTATPAIPAKDRIEKLWPPPCMYQEVNHHAAQSGSELRYFAIKRQ